MEQKTMCRDFSYGELMSDIKAIHSFAEPLMETSGTSPQIGLVSRIHNLTKGLTKEVLEKLSTKEVGEIRTEVEECKKLLEEISYEYILRLLRKPEPSKVFRILGNADLFEKILKESIGREITLEEGKSTNITGEMAEALTRYKFSIGTPPVTPEGLETLEVIMFGASLSEIYGFRDMLGADKKTFDGLFRILSDMVEQSSHYTTSGEKKEYENESREFNGLEGMRKLTRTVVSGTANTAVRLIGEKLFIKHSNGTNPINTAHTELNDELFEAMKNEQETIFVVRLNSVPYNIFSDRNYTKWRQVIGRLILVDDSDNSRLSQTTMVYSLNPAITGTLSKLHVKNAGTPSNVQMNLRKILEQFEGVELKSVRDKVLAMIGRYEEKGVKELDPAEIRAREWLVREQKHYLSLTSFLKFLDFIIQIKDGNEEKLNQMNSRMRSVSADYFMEYFFSDLKKEDVACHSIPLGGGRFQLGEIIGQWEREKIAGALRNFKEEKDSNGVSKIEGLRQRLNAIKMEKGVPKDTSVAEMNAAIRALSQIQSPNSTIRDAKSIPGITQNIAQRARTELFSMVNDTMNGGVEALGKIENFMLEMSSSNISGEMKARIENLLERGGKKELAKRLESGMWRRAGNALRAVKDTAYFAVSKLENVADRSLRDTRATDDLSGMDEAENMLDMIERGGVTPTLALCEEGWSYSDVLEDEDFPAKNYIKIKTTNNGEPDFSSLKEHLREKKERLGDFPELFELYCSTIVIVFNDPHNPFSKVASQKTKLELLSVADEFGLTIISDEAYFGLVKGEIKKRDGVVSLMQFALRHKRRFKNMPTILSSFSSTKMFCGGGRRTGWVITNDNSLALGSQSGDMDGTERNETSQKQKAPGALSEGQSMGITEIIDRRLDGANTVSMYFDIETVKLGIAVKQVSKKLREALTLENPVSVVDELLKGDYCNLSSPKFCAPIYFSLMECRNRLDKLLIRGALPMDLRKYINGYISELKNFRLDKRTQRDSVKRASSASNAIQRVSEDYPALKEMSIVPEGPFYLCVKIDEGLDKDPGFTMFLEKIARYRKIDVVPTATGYVRFAFGGMSEGTPEGYDLLSLAIETDLRILLSYWEKFKTSREKLRISKDSFPTENALSSLFEGGVNEIARTVMEKAELLDALQSHPPIKRRGVIDELPRGISSYVSKIEPGSKTEIITLKNVHCENMEQFVTGKPFEQIYNHYLKKIQSGIEELKHLSGEDLLAEYGALRFAEKTITRKFKSGEKEVFAKIARNMARIFFSDETIKILAQKHVPGVESGVVAGDIIGKSVILKQRIKDVLLQFLSLEEVASLLRPAVQVGYQSIRGLSASPTLPVWLRTLIEKSEFAGQTIPTDSSPEMVTGAVARVPGWERGIYKRDGDGMSAPDYKYFEERLALFMEVMDPNEYVCKMAKVGPYTSLIVIHRSYTHYLAEELRLLPQIQLIDVDNLHITQVKPDTVSFLGIPSKVMGEDYKIGYFIDKDTYGKAIPVTWVNRENTTDYVGYLKKPILTAINEKVEENGGLSVHGAAITIIFKNGLRKTIVFAGDSGTGKSETIIAMVEQIIKGEKFAEEVERVDLLAGDMLSLHQGVGIDGQKDIYLFGTEQGDFMRMSDIPGDWKERWKDLIERGSKSNLQHPTNPRITIPGLCDPKKFWPPVRVNAIFNNDNFSTPPESGAFMKEDNSKMFIMDQYVRGYRGEKGTSGDQPNIFASIFHGKDFPGKEALLKRYGDELDNVLGWDIEVNKEGKSNNAYLNFKDIPGKAFVARQMIEDVFINRVFKFKGESCEIVKTEYDIETNRFFAIIRRVDDPTELKRIPLDREKVFNQIFTPIVSTYCGHPFVSPESKHTLLAQFAGAIERARVITGTLFTQLKVAGMEEAGPAMASQAVFKFLLEDESINTRFLKFRTKVNSALKDKYGKIIDGHTIPTALQAYNLFLYERYESDTIRLIDGEGRPIDISTPYYHYDENARTRKFSPSLIIPETKKAITFVCDNEDYKHVISNFKVPGIAKYSFIKNFDSKEELVYQILLDMEVVKLGDESGVILRNYKAVAKAGVIADAIINSRKANNE